MPPKSNKPANKGQKKKHKAVYVAPKPTKPKLWVTAAPGVGMLRYRPECKEIRITALARRFKNASACIVAPVYAAVETFKEWSTPLLENVFQIGNEVHRITQQQLKLRANSSFPIQCVCPTFFLNSNKVTILVRPSSPTGPPIQGGATTGIEDDQVRTADRLSSENHGVIVQCASKTFSFWKDRGMTYALIPEGFGSADNYMPTLLKSKSLKSILTHSLIVDHGVCSLYVVKVLSKMQIPMTLDNLEADFQVPEPRESVVLEDTIQTEEVAEVKPVEEPPPTKAKPRHGKKVEEPEPEQTGPTEDMILSFSADYKEIDANRGILYGKEYCKDPDRILHTIIAAALFLHHFPANLWTSAIIRDIMKLGKKIFYHSESEDLLDNEDWMDRVKFPIKFIKKDFQASFDKSIFGRVLTTEKTVLSIEQGLKKFFELNDTGIIVGPQMVLVWQHKNNYFMFDPKERDGLGRKWTRMLSAELGSTALSGSACITWYRHPKKLAEVYIETIALKHRKDPYRIIKIQLFETFTKPEDEGDWIGMSESRWILVGTKTLCDYSYADDKMRVGKAICIGVAALVAAMEMAEDEWESSTIDGILTEGIEVFKQSVPSHEADKGFTLASIKRIIDTGGRRMRMTFVDCTPHGPMLGESKVAGSVLLRNGLTEFFDSTRYGLFTVKDIALAIWRGSDQLYYLFYPYEKLFGIPAQCLCSYDSTLPPMGLANAMRFRTINDLFSFLSTCLNTKENDEYCLNPVDVHLSESTGRPPIQEYEEFGAGGAILRPFKDLHEGHEMFGVRGDKQTLANLLTALGFNRINSAVNWSKEDIADILYIGDKIFCKVFMSLPECQARDYQLQWDDVIPVIGMNKFTFTREPIVGSLEIMPEVMGEEMEYEGGDGAEGIDYENEEGVEAQDDELFVRPQGSIIREEPALTKDLRGILQTWDKKKSDFHEAILETDFYRIAIWKRDDKYFIFDSKASGENGELTERRIEIGKDKAATETFSVVDSPIGAPDQQQTDEREKMDPLLLEKRNYQEFDNEGTAFTAWFSDFDEFYDHIAGKTPEEYKYNKFTLHDLVLKAIPVETGDFEYQLKPGFRAISPNHSITRGSIRQTDPSLANRGKQEITNALVAIAFAKITPSSKMTTTLLDVVLRYGDRLYSKSMSALKKVDKEKFCELEKLSLDDVSPIFSIYKIKFNWKVHATSKGNWTNAELKKAVGKLGTIEGGNAVILVHKGYLMAFWRSDGFYLYDPFETNPVGVVAENGLPSMSKFGKIDSLLNYLVSKFVCFNGPSTFSMFTINIKSQAVQDLQVEAPDADEQVDKSRLISYIPKNQEMFQTLQGDMRILKSPLSSAKIPQHSMALAALVHSRLQFVELWNYNIAQRIAFLSRYLLQKSDCEFEHPQQPFSFDDIRCSFAIDNDILCHIAFTKNMQGPIYSTKRTEIVGVNLKNALTMFFRNCQHVVASMPGFGSAFAIWKENGKYYLFGIDRIIPEMYIICSPVLPTLFDILLKGVDPEASVNNWYELRSVSVTTVPIKEGICKPIKRARKGADGPLSSRGAHYSVADSKDAHFFDHIAEKPEGLLMMPTPTGFVDAGDGIEVLYSKDLLRDHRFYGSKDFFSCIQATCVEASALSRVKSPSTWTKKTLERLLSAGTNLYMNTVAVKGTSNIQIIDFKGNFFVAKYKLEVCPLPPTVQGASKDDLLICLTWVLRKYQTAYLYTENFCFTLILERNQCYLFYPGSNDMLCDDIENNCSCLIRFCSISELLDKLLTNGEVSQCENICIGPIYVYQH